MHFERLSFDAFPLADISRSLTAEAQRTLFTVITPLLGSFFTHLQLTLRRQHAWGFQVILSIFA